MSPCADLAQSVGGGFPRVSGDEPLNAVSGGTADTFSPRERG